MPAKPHPILGWTLTLLPSAFLLMDATMKLIKPDFVVKATMDLGYPESAILPIGIALLISTLLYLIPQTAVLGAILIAGYLGGAIASHLRHGDPTWMIFFPALFSILTWLALLLRDPRLRSLLPFRKPLS